jgi:hypothetical protein
VTVHSVTAEQSVPEPMEVHVRARRVDDVGRELNAYITLDPCWTAPFIPHNEQRYVVVECERSSAECSLVGFLVECLGPFQQRFDHHPSRPSDIRQDQGRDGQLL